MVASHAPRDEHDNPFDGLDDVQVLERAKAALRRVHASSMGSLERSVQWALYEQAHAELEVRMYQYALRKIEEGK